MFGKVHKPHENVARVSSSRNNDAVAFSAGMSSSIFLSRHQVDQLLRWLKDFRASGGVIAINDLQRYLHQCLRAQALQDQGFKARVRGQWQHWLLVVEGGKREKGSKEISITGPLGLSFGHLTLSLLQHSLDLLTIVLFLRQAPLRCGVHTIFMNL